MIQKLTLSAVAIALFTYGCENISNPDPIEVINEESTAVIQGTAYANLDETNDDAGSVEEDYERAPEGTLVKVTIDSEDLVPNPNGSVNYQILTYTTTIDADGNFSIEVPAISEAVDAVLDLDNFVANQTEADSTVVEEVFTPDTPTTISIVEGFNYYNDVEYTD